MYRGSNILPVKHRKMFANALILPHFEYLDILYKKVTKIALGVEKP